MTDDKAPTQGRGMYQAAAEDLRVSAKWFIVALAAVGATLFGGLQLTSFSKIDQAVDPWRMPLAVGAFIIAVLGILGAVWALASFLSRDPLTLPGMVSGTSREAQAARASIDGDATILGEIADVAALQERIEQTVDQSRAIASTLRGDEADTDTMKQYQDVSENLRVLQSIAANVLGRAMLIMANLRYRRTLRRVTGWIALVVVGGVVFAVAVAQPPAKERPGTPVITVAIRQEGGVRSLTAKTTVDGVTDGSVVQVQATWGSDAKVIFKSKFGETQGSAVGRVEVILPEGRTGAVDLVAEVLPDPDVVGGGVSGDPSARVTVEVPTVPTGPDPTTSVG